MKRLFLIPLLFLSACDTVPQYALPSPPAREYSQQIGDLKFAVKSLRMLPENNMGAFMATVSFVNLNATVPIVVATSGGGNFVRKTSLVNANGNTFRTSDVTGLNWAVENVALNGTMTYFGSFTEIPPGQSIMATINFHDYWNSAAGNFGPYQLQSEIFVGTEQNGQPVNVTKSNFVIQIDTAQ